MWWLRADNESSDSAWGESRLQKPLWALLWLHKLYFSCDNSCCHLKFQHLVTMPQIAPTICTFWGQTSNVFHWLTTVQTNSLHCRTFSIFNIIRIFCFILNYFLNGVFHNYAFIIILFMSKSGNPRAKKQHVADVCCLLLGYSYHRGGAKQAVNLNQDPHFWSMNSDHQRGGDGGHLPPRHRKHRTTLLERSTLDSRRTQTRFYS